MNPKLDADFTEPKPADESLQKDSADGDLTEPPKRFWVVLGCFAVLRVHG
jgi:hypothetical protein